MLLILPRELALSSCEYSHDLSAYGTILSDVLLRRVAVLACWVIHRGSDTSCQKKGAIQTQERRETRTRGGRREKGRPDSLSGWSEKKL